MTEKINTGRFRIRKEIIGKAGTRETIMEFNNLEECSNEFTNVNVPSEYVFYIEEETFYKGTQTDSDGNPIDSAPGWTRMT